MDGWTDDLGRARGPGATSCAEGHGLGVRAMGLVALPSLPLTPWSPASPRPGTARGPPHRVPTVVLLPLSMLPFLTGLRLDLGFQAPFSAFTLVLGPFPSPALGPRSLPT